MNIEGVGEMRRKGSVGKGENKMLRLGRGKFLSGVFAVFVALMAYAQGAQQGVYTTYYADEVEKRPGIIYVSRGYNTIFRTYDKIEAYAITKGDVVQAQLLDPSTLWFTTDLSQGMTGFTVIVSGRVLQFSIVVKNGDFNRTYFIEPSRSIYGGPILGGDYTPSTQSPGTPTTSTRLATNNLQARSGDVLFPNITFTLKGVEASRVLIGYYAVNDSNYSFYLDSKKLEVTQGGKMLDFTLSRVPAKTLLGPGERQSGTITVKVDRSLPIKVRWVVRSETGEDKVYESTINIVEK